MHPFALAAAALVLASSVSCRRQQSDEIGGVGDTTSASAAEPAPAAEVPDPAAGIQDFTFDQRQEFVQSIRQQLAEVDQQATELGRQVKSRGGAVSDRAVARLLQMRRTVERDLGRVNTATAADWEQIKNDITQGVDQLNEGIQAAQPK
jgi:hypothetical protein